MNEINRVVRAAAWRVGVSNFITGFVVALSASLLVMMALRVVERSSNLVMMWDRVSYTAAGICLVIGVVWAIWSRPSSLDVARKVDEGAGLKESLSTAMCVAPRQGEDPWARATVETATRQARGVRMSQAVPVTPPKFWPVPIALGLALAVVFLAMPRVNWFSVGGVPGTGEDPLAIIQQAKAEKLDVQNKIEQMTKSLDLPKPPEQPAAEEKKPEPTTAEEVRREELKQLGSLNDRLEALRAGAQGQKLDNLQQRLKNLNNTGDKTADLSKALAAGDFSQAKAELQKLRDQAKQGAGQGGPGADKKKELAKQIDELAKQLDKLAQNQDALKKQLEAAGVNAGAATSPEDIQKAIEQSPNLSAEQKQQLSEAAQAMQQSQQSMQGLSQAMQQMSQSMQSGDQSGEQQSGESAMGQLSEMEQLAQDMAMAAAAQSEARSRMSELAGQCKGDGQCMGEGQGGDKPGMSNNPWSDWASRMSSSSGMRNGQGSGSGGTSVTERAAFDKEERKNIGPMGQGPIVGSRMIEGESIKGESRAEFARAVARGEQSATESIENNAVPREYHGAIKNYFGRIKSDQKAANKAAEPGAGGAEPANAPAKDADSKKN